MSLHDQDAICISINKALQEVLGTFLCHDGLARGYLHEATTDQLMCMSWLVLAQSSQEGGTSVKAVRSFVCWTSGQVDQ